MYKKAVSMPEIRFGHVLCTRFRLSLSRLVEAAGVTYVAKYFVTLRVE